MNNEVQGSKSTSAAQPSENIIDESYSPSEEETQEDDDASSQYSTMSGEGN